MDSFDYIVKYYPVGTKWTEIRIDTARYKEWYRKEGEDWVPNYERIDYYVAEPHGMASRYDNAKFRFIYCQREGRPDSLCQFVTESIAKDSSVCVLTNYPINYNDSLYINCREPEAIYCFDRPQKVGDVLSYSVGWLHHIGGPLRHYYGVITEIGEKNFGGERPLKYYTIERNPKQYLAGIIRPDTLCMVHGIGITSWYDGECVFGPYAAFKSFYFLGPAVVRPKYRSMLVHFERNGEVLYDMWPMPGENPDGVCPAPVSPSGGGGSVYDLHGRRLNKAPERGMYIQDGRVRMVW